MVKINILFIIFLLILFKLQFQIMFCVFAKLRSNLDVGRCAVLAEPTYLLLSDQEST